MNRQTTVLVISQPQLHVWTLLDSIISFIVKLSNFHRDSPGHSLRVDKIEEDRENSIMITLGSEEEAAFHNWCLLMKTKNGAVL